MKLFCFITLCLLGLAGCSNQDTNQTREEAAKAAAELKKASKEAGKEIRKGAEEARKQGAAVAEGVREGWNSDSKVVNLNSASKTQLMSLPGIDAKSANRIISGRPYKTKEDLENRGILSPDEYQGIQDHIAVK